MEATIELLTDVGKVEDTIELLKVDAVVSRGCVVKGFMPIRILAVNKTMK